MGLLDEWLETFESVLAGPTDHFSTEQRQDGFGYPLKFALVSLVLAAVFNAVRAGFLGGTTLGQMLPAGGNVLVALGVLVVSPVVGLAGLLVTSALVHIFVALLGGEGGYSETLSVFEYATAVSPLTSLMALVPVAGGIVNLLLGIYAIYIQVRGLEGFQGLSALRSLVALLLPGFVLVLLLAGLAAVFMGSSSLAAMQTMQAAPIQ